MNSHSGYVMKSGGYMDQPIQRVPTDYLTWMVNADHTEAEAAKAELERRKSVIGSVEILPVAVDRASTGCLRVWERTRNSREGLYSWLVRMANGALASGVEKEGKLAYGGMFFSFDRSGPWPLLKAVSVEKTYGLN